MNLPPLPAILAAAIALSACDHQPSVLDQCLRVQLFQQCMTMLPAGPVATKYNDWSEVVEACQSQATYSAYRRTEQVKPECRS